MRFMRHARQSCIIMWHAWHLSIITAASQLLIRGILVKLVTRGVQLSSAPSWDLTGFFSDSINNIDDDVGGWVVQVTRRCR